MGNTKGCREDGFCVKRHSDWGEQIGPDGGLEMHPKCAWGILGLLNGTYRYPSRTPSWNAGIRAAGIEKYFPQNWIKLISAYLSGGVGAVTVAGAHEVSWKRRLSPKCLWGVRSQDDI